MGDGADVARENEEHAEAYETLDEFMLRQSHSPLPNSLKRIAWATGSTLDQVAKTYDRLAKPPTQAKEDE